MQHPTPATLVALLLSCTHLLASGTGMSPDGGALLSHTEQGLAAHRSKPVEGFPLEYYPRLRWTDDFSIQIEAIVLHGNALVGTDKLQVALRPFVGRRISVQRFSAITRVVEKAYRENGQQAHAYVPEQSFSRGKLIIQVIEK